MQKIHLTTFINAPREKVWNTMLDDATYRAWTSVFNPTSYYKGDWEQGSKMLFLGTDEGGKEEGGMVSRIKENRKYEYVAIEHLGMVKNGVEVMDAPEMKDWAGAMECYTFVDKDGGTELVIDMDVAASEGQAMEDMWVKALEKLKALAEA